MGVVLKAMNGLVTAAGEAISEGTTISSGQVVYGLTASAKSVSWPIRYDKGDESAMLVTPTFNDPGEIASVSGRYFSKLGVGLGTNAGSMKGSPVTVRLEADTFNDTLGIYGSILTIENKEGRPMAALHLNTETVAWASATGTIDIGFIAEADEPVDIENAELDVNITNAELDVDVGNTSPMPVMLKSVT